jgi:rhodanese-related sulfurtransferase
MKNFTQTRLLALLAVLFALVLAVGYLTSQRKDHSYQLSPEETLAKIQGENAVATTEEVKNNKGRSGFVLIDLRDQGEYVKGYIEGAWNVPVASLLDEESLDLLEDESVTFVLYGKDAEQAYGPWLLLQQMGYTNVKVLAGGYSAYVQDSTYTPDKAAYDYAEVMEKERKKLEEEFKESAKPAPAPPPKKKEVIIPKKRKAQQVVEEEGC